MASDSKNFFNTTDLVDPSYWDTYLAARPTYTKEFYDLIYAYHTEHGNGSFGLAHDVATGPGQVAAVLAQRFKRVIVSDLVPAHLNVAKERLSGLGEKTEFVCHNGETLDERFPAGEADMIIGGMCLGLMDYKRAIDGYVKVLKPGGTIAFWMFGRPNFSEPTSSETCQPVYDKIVNKLMAEDIKRSPFLAGLKRGSSTMGSWLDNVPFPEEHWKSVQRHKWNPHLPLMFCDDSACPFEVVRSSSITPNEAVIEKRDPSFWAEKWNVKEVRRFIEFLMPSSTTIGRDEEVESWYKELGVAMGGEDTKRDIAWPVILLLATRR